MARKEPKKAPDIKVRALVKQIHALQVAQGRQLSGIAKAIVGGTHARPALNGHDSTEGTLVLEQKVSELKTIRAKLEVELDELRAENARGNALVQSLYTQIEAWRVRLGRLIEEIEVRLRVSAEQLGRHREQHSRLLRELGDAGFHMIVDPLRPGSAVEQRFLQALNAKRPDVAKSLGVSDFVTLGDKANADKDWKLAIDCYASALQRDPSLVAIWVQFGHALKEEGLLGLAEVAYHRAAELDPQSVDAHVQIGHFQARIGQAGAAYAAFARAAALDATVAPLAKQAAQVAASAEANSDTVRSALKGLMGEVTEVLAAKRPVPSSSAEREAGARAEAAGLVPADSLNRSLGDRYGALLEEAMGTRTGQDVVWLGVIDWHFRIQRPQHLASRLAAQGRRVFYVSISFERADSDGRFRILGSPQLNVFEVRLRLRGAIPANIYGGFDDAQIDDIRAALDEVIAVLSIRSPAVVVQYPSWYPVAIGVPGALVVHDCLDLVGGFDNVPPAMVELERLLTRDADLVITSSEPLRHHVGRNNILVRNGAEIEHFAQAARADERPPGVPPTIGYFGAIAEWFEIDWLLDCARARSDWRFQLIGNITGFDRSQKSIPDNVIFTGEIPYAELPSRLKDFDVALIPFKLTDLILCTNPVKMYEYMAAGKPVVATAMPEVVNGSDFAYIAVDAGDLEKQIARALAEDSPDLRRRRMAWAANHSWESRASGFADALAAASPKVSIVILTHNNWAFSRACLHSVFALSDYPNLEIIVVDNASTDETRDRLREIRDPRVRVILNERNVGFAAGNNAGLHAATGDYIVILNNDTYVTKGWVRDLIRPMMLDPTIGLVGPVTNNIGNEQKLSIKYADMYEMATVARRRIRAQLRTRFEATALAFFCVALSRTTLERVGYLDEVYGLGFFEDDDYCRRVEKAGMRMFVVDDAFVHHHLSASFNALGMERKRQQMERNKAIYEERWGPWKLHVYRDAVGYGS